MTTRASCCLAILLFLVSPAWANSYVFSSQTSQVAHEVISSSLQLRISHPFRIVKLHSDNIRGVLLADFQDLSRGIRMEVYLETTSLLGADRNITDRVRRVLRSSQFPKIQYAANKVNVLDGATPTFFPLLVDGDLTIADRTSASQFRLDCQSEGTAIVCTLGTVIKPSDFAVPLPRLLGLVTNDRVDISGMVTFRAQR